jgi:hypothetical protein
MNSRPLRTGVRIVGAESGPQLRPITDRHSDVGERDERERDWRPGRFAVRGPFIDLAALEDMEANMQDRRGA